MKFPWIWRRTFNHRNLLMMKNSPQPRGNVVVYSCKACHPDGHENMTRHALAKKLAALIGFAFEGEFDARRRYDGSLYFVPGDTLLGDDARALGIRAEDDLFGAVVPFAYVGTKTITHPLAGPESRAPHGWCHGFTEAVRDVVLPGFAVFTREDLRAAGSRLLAKGGEARLKKASGIGGSGQDVVTNTDELEACIRSYDPDELLRDGAVVEQNLGEVVTYSVGQVRVRGALATYYGTQRLTANNNNEEVYGGSNLVVVRGGFEAMQKLEVPPEVQTAIRQARIYHDAALACFPGMFASRSNYDIAQGRDAEGRWYSGVLEQSWRIGGASAAELAALEVFAADPSCDVICASTNEVYGEAVALPADAMIYFQGIDDAIGPLTKFVRVESYVKS